MVIMDGWAELDNSKTTTDSNANDFAETLIWYPVGDSVFCFLSI